MNITYEQLHAIMRGGPRGLQRFVDPLNAAMAEFEINNKARVTTFLAQLGHESGSLRYMEELATGTAYEGRRDLGNHEQAAIDAAAVYGMTPGKFFKGHGPIQITGYYNHRDCGLALGLDLIAEPELLTDPVHGCRAAGWFWKSRGLNEAADAGKFELITRRINGGLNGWEDRNMYLMRAMEEIA